MTAYEMRISDWSSDVCSSDLLAGERGHGVLQGALQALGVAVGQHVDVDGDVHAVAVGVEHAGRRLDGLALHHRSEERRVGKECVVRVDLGGRRIIKKKNKNMELRHTIIFQLSQTKHITDK